MIFAEEAVESDVIKETTEEGGIKSQKAETEDSEDEVHKEASTARGEALESNPDTAAVSANSIEDDTQASAEDVTKEGCTEESIR